jgi:hypothetical protein
MSSVVQSSFASTSVLYSVDYGHQGLDADDFNNIFQVQIKD